MLSIKEARTRVARGAEHLDRVRPGWFNEIDTGTLTLDHPCGCVLGQLYRTSEEGFEIALLLVGIDLNSDADVDMGFEIDEDDDDDCDYEDIKPLYLPLQNAWIEAIAARKFPDAPAQALATPPSRSAVDPVEGRVAMVHARRIP